MLGLQQLDALELQLAESRSDGPTCAREGPDVAATLFEGGACVGRGGAGGWARLGRPCSAPPANPPSTGDEALRAELAHVKADLAEAQAPRRPHH